MTNVPPCLLPPNDQDEPRGVRHKPLSSTEKAGWSGDAPSEIAGPVPALRSGVWFGDWRRSKTAVMKCAIFLGKISDIFLRSAVVLGSKLFLPTNFPTPGRIQLNEYQLARTQTSDFG